jgi:hypothetical protein
VGDVLLLTTGGRPQHLGILTGAHVVHCWGRPREVRAVVAHPVDVALRAWPLASAWRFPSVSRDG